MLKKLIHDKINEVFAEYQEVNGIASGDITPWDALRLEALENTLEKLIKEICANQPTDLYADLKMEQREQM